MADGLRRASMRVKDLSVTGSATGNFASGAMTNGNTWYVDGDISASGDGTTWEQAFKTIAEGIAAASSGDVCYVVAKTHTDYTGDPVSYEENLTIPYATSNFALIGVSRGRTQGGLPQLKDGATTTQHILRIRAPGCYIANLGFNGAGNTGGGILFDDDYAAKAAFGTSIVNCHFKNCKGTTATNAATGGAINWGVAGNAWQILISGCRFYKNVGDIVMAGSDSSVPQDVVIEDCIFSGPATSVDCNIYCSGTGINGLYIRNCVFPALPAIGSATNGRFMILTSCVGMVSDCVFGCVGNVSGTALTFKASGTGATVPSTVFFCRNHGQSGTDGESAELSIA